MPHGRRPSSSRERAERVGRQPLRRAGSGARRVVHRARLGSWDAGGSAPAVRRAGLRRAADAVSRDAEADLRAPAHRNRPLRRPPRRGERRRPADGRAPSSARSRPARRERARGRRGELGGRPRRRRPPRRGRAATPRRAVRRAVDPRRPRALAARCRGRGRTARRGRRRVRPPHVRGDPAPHVPRRDVSPPCRGSRPAPRRALGARPRDRQADRLRLDRAGFRADGPRRPGLRHAGRRRGGEHPVRRPHRDPRAGRGPVRRRADARVERPDRPPAADRLPRGRAERRRERPLVGHRRRRDVSDPRRARHRGRVFAADRLP